MMTTQSDQKVRNRLALPMALAGLMVGGCTPPVMEQPSAITEQISEQQERLEARNQEIAELSAALEQEREERNRLEIEARMPQRRSGARTGAGAAAPLTDLPQNPVPGECYARVFIPPKYETVTDRVKIQDASTKKEIVVPPQYEWREERVLVQEASERIETIPAEYEVVEEQVIVKEAGERIESTPPKYKWVDEQIVVKEPGERIETTPPEYEWVEERVVVEPPSERIKVIPAEYAWEDKKVLVQDAITSVQTIPASYRTVKENVLDKPAHTVWKKGENLISELDLQSGRLIKIDEETGDILCLVEVPATYKTVSKQMIDTEETTRTVEISPPKFKTVRTRVLKRPAQTSTTEIPPKYKTVRKKVLKRPAQTRTVEIPPKYKTVRKQVLVEPAQTRVIPISPKYKTVRKKVLTSPPQTKVVEIPPEYKTVKVKVQITPAQTEDVQVPAKYETITTQAPLTESKTEWRSVLCETNMTSENVRSLQTALSRAGFSPGKINGVINKATKRAVDKYQRKKRLSRGGITYETIESLNVEIIK
jgi:hypothetical protein